MATILDQLNGKRKEKQELETANIAILEETSENPDAAKWKLHEWQSWLEDNGFSLTLIHSALQQAYSASGHQEEFEAILSMEHCDALIADAFWYYICAVIKKTETKYEAHNEFLLDRMAANYVSYTLVEDPGISSETKAMFFRDFYNHLA